MTTEEEIFKKYNKKDGEIHTSDWLLKQAIHEATKAMAKRARKFAKDKDEYNFVFCDELY